MGYCIIANKDLFEVLLEIIADMDKYGAKKKILLHYYLSLTKALNLQNCCTSVLKYFQRAVWSFDRLIQNIQQILFC